MIKISEAGLGVVICLGLTLMTLAVYWPVNSHDFINYDDDEYVTENPHVQKGFTAESIRWAFTTGYAANWHPLTWLSHMLDCQFFRLDAGRHHLVNVLLHIANTLLLFAVFRRMTGAIWPSAFVAAAFAVHPLHVESVAWIAERKDVLSTLFWMLTMAAYVSYATRGGMLRYMVVLLSFALGLMAKPMLVTLPFVLLLLDYWPLGRFGSGGTSSTRLRVRLPLIYEKIPLFVLSAASSVVTFIVQQRGGAVTEISRQALGASIANGFVSYAVYIHKMIWPSKLAVLYPYPAGDNYPVWMVIGSVALLIVLSILAVKVARRRPYVLFGWLWFLGTLVPVIGLIQIGERAMADRYTYVPFVGLFVVVAWGFAELPANNRFGRIVCGILSIAVVVGMCVCTRLQLRFWRDSRCLFERAVAVTKNNSTMHYGLAREYVAAGKLDMGTRHFRQAIVTRPSYADAHVNLGYILYAQSKNDEAITHYRKAIAVRPDFAEAYNNLGVALQAEGRLSEAIKQFNRAVRLNPDFLEAHSNLSIALEVTGRGEDAARHRALSFGPDATDAQAQFNLAEKARKLGRFDESVRRYRLAIEVRPDYPEAHNGLGFVLQRQGRAREAVEYFRQAVKIKPDFAVAYYNLGIGLKSLGETQEAASSYRKAIKSDPRHLMAHNNLANLLAEQGRYDEAVEQHRTLLKIWPDFADGYSNFGLTLIQMGRFDEALQQYREALKLDRDLWPALKSAALLLAYHPDPGIRDVPSALKMAERAAELTEYSDISVLDALAKVYAAATRFEDAISTCHKILELASGSGNDALAAKMRGQIRIYQQAIGPVTSLSF